MRPGRLFGFFFLIINCFFLGVISTENQLGTKANVRRVTMSNRDGSETAVVETTKSEEGGLDGTAENKSSSEDTNEVRGTDSGDW